MSTRLNDGHTRAALDTPHTKGTLASRSATPLVSSCSRAGHKEASSGLHRALVGKARGGHPSSADWRWAIRKPPSLEVRREARAARLDLASPPSPSAPPTARAPTVLHLDRREEALGLGMDSYAPLIHGHGPHAAPQLEDAASPPPPSGALITKSIAIHHRVP